MLAAVDRPALRAKLPDLLGIDLRSLAAFRIGMGALLLVNLASRLPYIGAFYADDGVLPRAVLNAAVPDPAPLALHALSGDVAFPDGRLAHAHRGDRDSPARWNARPDDPRDRLAQGLRLSQSRKPSSNGSMAKARIVDRTTRLATASGERS